MANYNNLRNIINSTINSNGAQAITGAKHNNVLNTLLTTLTQGFQLLGVATPATEYTPGDANVAFLACTSGTYAGLGSLVVYPGEVALLTYDGTAWSKSTVFSLSDALDELKREEYRKHYLTFEAAEDGVDIYFACPEDNEDVFVTVEVSTDGGATWTEKTSSYAEDYEEGTLLATLDKGETLLVRGSGPTGYYSEDMDEVVGNFFYVYSGKAYVYGNVMSLLGGSNFAGLDTIEDENAFASLFSDYNEAISGDLLASHPDKPLVLPATTLAEYCYGSMFSSCTGLTAAPALPATTLAQYCYQSMFNGCTGLTAAPALPATTLAQNCYGYMFNGCTSLTAAPELPATTLKNSCYNYMFSGCTSLTAAPELPATTLENYCYSNMFSGCTQLASVVCSATDISASNALYRWLRNVSATGTFTKAAGVNYPSGESGIPTGWTVEEAA